MRTPEKLWWTGGTVGVLAWVAVASGLHRDGHFDHDPNLFCIKGSPYGRTLAYAMRGPADLYWHRGQTEDHGEIEEDQVFRGLEADEETPTLAAMIVEKKREFDEEEAEHAAEAHGDEKEAPAASTRERLLRLIGDMRATYYTRTNHFGDTPQIESWRYSETEKRLKLSHELDPTNLICYGSYFMFVSESVSRLKGAENEEQVIARRQEHALGIALGTLEACMRFRDEPGALITAASAANDAVNLLAGSNRAKPGAAEEMDRVFRASLQAYVDVRDARIADGTWENFSAYRRQEMEDAFNVLRVIHHAGQEQANRTGPEGAGHR